MEKPESLWIMNDTTKEVHDKQAGHIYYPIQDIDNALGKPIVKKVDIPGTLVAYNVRFIKRPVHFFRHKLEDLVFCDFASSTETMADNQSVRVWFPQPLYMNDLFPKDCYDVISGLSAFEDDAPETL